MNEITNWIQEWYSYDDYVLYNDILEQAPSNFWFNQKQYNQNLVHRNSCFIHWPAWALSDLLWINWFTEELEDMTLEAFDESWADPSWWWYFQPAVKFVAEKARAKGFNIWYYRIPYWDWESALNRGYSIVTWYKISKEQKADKKDDWILNFSTWDYWPTKGGHCIRLTKLRWSVVVVDNYYKVTDFNTYKVSDIIKQVKEWNFFTCWYIYVMKEAVRDWYQGMTVKQKIEKLRNRKKPT